MTTKTKPKKTWDMVYVQEKYDISPEEAKTLIQAAGLVPGKHLGRGGLYKIGLMEIGKYIKNNPLTPKEQQPNEDGKVFETLYMCGKPPNQLKLWVCRKMDGATTSTKFVCNVPRKVHHGYKPGVAILCEKIDEGLYVHPPRA